MWSARAVCLLLIASLGCGRINFEDTRRLDGSCTACSDSGPMSFDSGPRADAGPPRDGGPRDGGTPITSCVDIGGRACNASESCAVDTVPSLDVGDCCPGSDCLDRSTRLVGEALRGTATLGGGTGEWDGAPQWPILKVTQGPTPLAPSDLSGTFAARWDDTHLYLLVTVVDDVLSAMTGRLPWQDDSIELYLDMDPHTLDATWDADETWCYLQRNGTVVMGTSVTAVFPEAAAFGTTATGWFFEVSVAWPTTPPPSGTVIGFDVAINDDDLTGGGTRASQLFWSDGDGQLYRDASLLGLLRLSGDSAPSSLPVCGNMQCDSGESTANCPADC